MEIIRPQTLAKLQAVTQERFVNNEFNPMTTSAILREGILRRKVREYGAPFYYLLPKSDIT